MASLSKTLENLSNSNADIASGDYNQAELDQAMGVADVDIEDGIINTNSPQSPVSSIFSFRCIKKTSQFWMNERKFYHLNLNRTSGLYNST